MAENIPPESDSAARRGFLGLAAVLAGIAGALVGVPAATLAAAPLFRTKDGGESWVPVGATSDFGAERRDAEYQYTAQDAWYQATKTRRVSIAQENGQWVVFDTTCTHVGCGVSWNPDQKQFVCPCHNGIFDASGNVVSGPPPAPLRKMESRVNPQTQQLEILES